jgi:hypothetical protein
MILYHFTLRERLPSIIAEGLNRGEVPLSPTLVDTAVNLTSAGDPLGTGIDRNEPIKFPSGLVLPTLPKITARIAVRIPSTDHRLKRWSSYARKRLDPAWRDALERGNRPETWWLYFGTVRADQFTEIALRQSDGSYRSLGETSDTLEVSDS